MNETGIKQALKIYKEGVNYLLDNIINFSNLSNAIDKSECHFAPSKTFKEYGYLSTSSPYFYLLNTFYLENLSNDDLEILNNKEKIDEDAINIIKRTLKDVITKKDVKSITYFNPTPETIIKNGTLVFIFVYGKNSKSLSDDLYTSNVKKQKEFIKLLKENFENGIKSSLDIECKLLSYKIL